MIPLLCRVMGHKWPRGLLSDAYVRIGVPTYWTVRSACQRPGCCMVREADLAGVNPRYGLPWGEAFRPDVNERPSRAMKQDALINRTSGRSAMRNVPKGTRLW